MKCFCASVSGLALRLLADIRAYWRGPMRVTSPPTPVQAAHATRPIPCKRKLLLYELLAAALEQEVSHWSARK